MQNQESGTRATLPPNAVILQCAGHGCAEPDDDPAAPVFTAAAAPGVDYVAAAIDKVPIAGA
ncbi:MAG TPA: hypothetical protein VFR29_05320 [Steroidobacteraceae bacterium]|nr:hypothetical protein [Steroidobacteraceae bacterium]